MTRKSFAISRADRGGPQAGEPDDAMPAKGATCGLKKVKASKTDQKRALFCTKSPWNCVFSSYFLAISHRPNGQTSHATGARVMRIAISSWLTPLPFGAGVVTILRLSCRFPCGKPPQPVFTKRAEKNSRKSRSSPSKSCLTGATCKFPSATPEGFRKPAKETKELQKSLF